MLKPGSKRELIWKLAKNPITHEKLILKTKLHKKAVMPIIYQLTKASWLKKIDKNIVVANSKRTIKPPKIAIRTAVINYLKTKIGQKIPRMKRTTKGLILRANKIRLFQSRLNFILPVKSRPDFTVSLLVKPGEVRKYRRREKVYKKVG